MNHRNWYWNLKYWFTFHHDHCEMSELTLTDCLNQSLWRGLALRFFLPQLRERELKIWYIYLYAHNKITIDSKLSLYSSGKKKSFIQSSEALAVCAKRIKTIVVLSPLNVTWIKSLAELCAWKNGLIFNQYQRSVVQNNEVSIQTLQTQQKKD